MATQNVATTIKAGSTYFPAMRDPEGAVINFPLKIAVSGYVSPKIALDLAERWTNRFNKTGKMIY